METIYIQFETAKLAKAKGFDTKTTNWYDQTETLNPCKGVRGAMCYTNEGYAPTQSELQKWLRDKHNIHIQIRRMYAHDGEVEYNDFVYLPNKNAHTDDTLGNEFPTYESALENALQTALNLL